MKRLGGLVLIFIGVLLFEYANHSNAIHTKNGIREQQNYWGKSSNRKDAVSTKVGLQFDCDTWPAIHVMGASRSWPKSTKNEKEMDRTCASLLFIYE